MFQTASIPCFPLRQVRENKRELKILFKNKREIKRKRGRFIEKMSEYDYYGFYYGFLKKWLYLKGYEVYEKVRYGRYEFDLIGAKGNKVVLIEVKEKYFRRLIKQAMKKAKLGFFSEIYIAFPFKRKPKINWLAKYGIGVIDLTRRKVVLKPKGKKHQQM